MTKALSVVRSILFFLYMALTVIPWGATVCLCAPFLSADQIYTWCINWVALAHHGSRWICGVRSAYRHGERAVGAGRQGRGHPRLKHQSTWETSRSRW